MAPAAEAALVTVIAALATATAVDVYEEVSASSSRPPSGDGGFTEALAQTAAQEMFEQITPAIDANSNMGIETISFNPDELVLANDNQGSGTGRGKNKRKPDPEAQGSHSVSNGRGSTTFEENSRNPHGFQEVKRVDTEGAAHGGVETPHVHEGGKVRPANPGDIPTDLSKNKGG